MPFDFVDKPLLILILFAFVMFALCAASKLEDE